jgi:hypothetical protein
LININININVANHLNRKLLSCRCPRVPEDVLHLDHLLDLLDGVQALPDPIPARRDALEPML